MNTQNIISTPDITGNIGSCTSQSIQTISGRTLFKENTISVVTNSCTGDVKEYQSWQFSEMGAMSLIAGIVVATFLLFVIGASIVEWIERH